MPNPENLEKRKPFKKGDPRINRKGRPPKLLKQLNAELKEKGYEPVTESQVVEAYLTLLNMDRNTILEYVKSGDVPAIFEIAAKGIGGKQGLQAVEKLLERALGKPKEKHDHTSSDGTMTPKIEIVRPDESK